MKIRDDRQMRALTGMSIEQFEILLEIFTETYKERAEQKYEQGKEKGERKRRPGGGQKGALPSMYEKLLFVLYYFKVYPTFDVLGTQFGMVRSKACENVYKLVPVLHESLVRLGVMPKREYATAAELMEELKGIETIVIDVTERNISRPQDEQEQREHYSGKKSVIRLRTPLLLV